MATIYSVQVSGRSSKIRNAGVLKCMQDTLCVGALTVVCAALTTVLALTTALAHESLLIVSMETRPTFAVRVPR